MKPPTQAPDGLITERDVLNSMAEPRNAAQRIYFPLLGRKMFLSLVGRHQDGAQFRQGTPERRHKNEKFTDDGVRITRGERKRAARAATIERVSELRPLRHFHPSRYRAHIDGAATTHINPTLARWAIAGAV